jgi:hypothetical protein
LFFERLGPSLVHERRQRDPLFAGGGVPGHVYCQLLHERLVPVPHVGLPTELGGVRALQLVEMPGERADLPPAGRDQFRQLRLRQ